jgi:nucleotide-binding universal stress UspA family protein
MYKTILVPLDGSKRAEAILPHVEELVQCYHTKVIFLQVIAPESIVVWHNGVYPEYDQQQLEQRIRKAEFYLAVRQAEFREKGIEADTYVVHGPAVEAIINIAEREGADLIAIASHGWADLSRVFYGNVAAGVLQRLDRLLLLIRSANEE